MSNKGTKVQAQERTVERELDHLSPAERAAAVEKDMELRLKYRELKLSVDRLGVQFMRENSLLNTGKIESLLNGVSSKVGEMEGALELVEA